jgi:chromosome segregation ATPase
VECRQAKEELEKMGQEQEADKQAWMRPLQLELAQCKSQLEQEKKRRQEAEGDLDQLLEAQKEWQQQLEREREAWGEERQQLVLQRVEGDSTKEEMLQLEGRLASSEAHVRELETVSLPATSKTFEEMDQRVQSLQRDLERAREQAAEVEGNLEIGENLQESESDGLNQVRAWYRRKGDNFLASAVVV